MITDSSYDPSALFDMENHIECARSSLWLRCDQMVGDYEYESGLEVVCSFNGQDLVLIIDACLTRFVDRSHLEIYQNIFNGYRVRSVGTTITNWILSRFPFYKFNVDGRSLLYTCSRIDGGGHSIVIFCEYMHMRHKLMERGKERKNEKRKRSGIVRQRSTIEKY